MQPWSNIFSLKFAIYSLTFLKYDQLKGKDLQGKELAYQIARYMLEKKANNVVIQDLRNVTTMTDFFVICDVDVDVHGKAILEHIKDQLINYSIKPWHTEGKTAGSWILVDFVDVVVHIFKKQTREFYGLEKLWGDAERIEIKEDNDTSGLHQ